MRVKGKDPKTWIDLLLIIFFCVVLYVCMYLVFFISIFQFLTCFFTGKTNKDVNGFSNILSSYFSKVLAYLTFNSDLKPFPFSEKNK